LDDEDVIQVLGLAQQYGIDKLKVTFFTWNKVEPENQGDQIDYFFVFVPLLTWVTLILRNTPRAGLS
jgi:ABC-type nitrate/sulfonate/bicarbonate transport system substrate-binding protein